MKSIIDTILGDREIPDDIRNKVQSSIQVKHVAKGEILLRENEKATHSFYVQKGLLRSYVIDKKGKEHIFSFAPEDWLISDMASQVQNTPSRLFIDAIEDSDIEIFDRTNFEKLGLMSSNTSSAGIKKLLRRVSVLQDRIIMLISATALERYQDFEKTYPNLIQRVPQKMIASYLGITPEALSKVRGEYARKK